MPQGPITAATFLNLNNQASLGKVDAAGSQQVNVDAEKKVQENVSAASVVKLGSGYLEALNNLSTTNLGYLTTTQLAALTVGQFYDMTTTQVASLTTTQIAQLGSGQVAALTTTQVAALSTSQLLGLAPCTQPTIGYNGTPFANALVYNPASSGQPASILYK